MKLALVSLFGVTSFLAAALVFSLEPMIGKMVVPLFGGTPAVWNTCLFYFQVAVLVGYACSGNVVAGATKSPTRVSAALLAVAAAIFGLGFALQPIRIAAEREHVSSVSGNPVLALLWILIGSTFLPLVAASASSPLLQRWFAISGHPRSHDPYFLYAGSNAGSLAALLLYPVLVEPNLTLNEQSRIWRIGFLVLALLLLTCGLVARRRGRSHGDAVKGDSTGANDSEAHHGPGQARSSPMAVPTRLRWLALAFVPSSWLQGVTSYVTSDLAAAPLFWIVPLALYLVSFILAFSASAARVVRCSSRALPIVVLPLVLVMAAGFVGAIWIPLHLLAFLLGSTACHGVLARLRPATEHLTTFYATIAFGGVLGGAFNVLLAPLIFDRIIEYPLAVVLACIVAPGVEAGWNSRTLRERASDLLIPAVVFLVTAALITNLGGLAQSPLGALGIVVASGLGVFACITARRRPVRFGLAAGALAAAGGLSEGPSGRLLAIERTFFGVVRVTADPADRVHRLFHGSTLHGEQSVDPRSSHEPSTYFSRAGPIGQVFSTLRVRLEHAGVRIAIVGLGAGTLACYALPSQDWTFYEIDPAIERIARDPRFFTYLRDCRARSLDVELGDARLRLQDAPDHAYQMIVLDPFSSDAIPLHILSREAIRLYRSKMAAGGVLAFHVSNRYLDFEPVLGAQAMDAGMASRIRRDTTPSAAERRAGTQPSIWFVMAEREADLGSIASDPQWREPVLDSGAAVWTDDYSDVLSVLRIWPRFGTGSAGEHATAAGVATKPDLAR
jgi:hypothetical protein